MIEFCGVGKTYVSKSKNRVEALKNVNFQLDEKGMVLILGKSGALPLRAHNSDGIIVRTDSVGNMTSFLLSLRYDYKSFVKDAGYVQSSNEEDVSAAGSIYDFEYIKEYAVILLIICVALVVVMIFLTINLISISISNRRKEIGILSAIGTASRNITKIFVFEALILSVIIAIVSMALTFASVAIINAVYSKSMLTLVQTVSFCTVDPYTFITLLGICFILLPLFALIPTVRIAKLKPIDAIRAL